MNIYDVDVESTRDIDIQIGDIRLCSYIDYAPVRVLELAHVSSDGYDVYKVERIDGEHLDCKQYSFHWLEELVCRGEIEYEVCE